MKTSSLDEVDEEDDYSPSERIILMNEASLNERLHEGNTNNDDDDDENDIQKQLTACFANNFESCWNHHQSNHNNHRRKKKLLYDGSKIIWKCKLLLDIYIYQHIDYHCLEIFTIHEQTHRHSNHIYISMKQLNSLLQFHEIKEYLENIKLKKLKKIKKNNCSNEKKSFHFLIELHKFLKEYYISYLINHLNVLENKLHSLKIFLKPTIHDIVIPNTNILETIIEKPDDLEYSKIPKRRTSS